MVPLTSIKISNRECKQHSQGILENICYHAMLPVIPCLHLLEALTLPPTAMMRLKNRLSTCYGLIRTADHQSSKLASLYFAYSNGCSHGHFSRYSLAPNYLFIKSYNGFQCSHCQLSITCHFLYVSTRPHSLACLVSKGVVVVIQLIGSHAYIATMVLFNQRIANTYLVLLGGCSLVFTA